MSGGGGSSGQTYYANQDKLFGTQADIAQNMYNEYANRAPTYLNNTASMTNEAMSGALATRARNQAGADASAAMGQGLQAAARNTARYGAEYNPNRMNQMNQDAAIQGAAMKSSAMNSAEQWAEDQKWNRNAGAYGQIAGMGSGAMEGMGSAGRGYGGMAAQMSQNDQANAQGTGMAGGYVGKALFAADGGLVSKRKRRSRSKKKDGVCLATGGLAPVNWRAQPTSGGGMGKKSGGVGQFLTAMAPAAMKYGMEKTGITDAVKGGLDSVWGGIKDAFAGQQGLSGTATTMADVGAASEIGGVATGGELTGTAAGLAGTGAEAAALAGTAADIGAAAEIGGMLGGMEAGATAGSVVPGIGTVVGLGAGALASLLGEELFADGGSVAREDMTHGGEVDGPGTETSDDIPAWLSDNEYVLNAEAVKMIGVDTLDAINQKGLEMRRGGPKKPQVSQHGLKLASGGNLGVALGSAAKTLMALDEQDQRNELIQIQKNKATQDAEAFGWQRSDQEERLRQRAAEQALATKYKPFFESAAKGDYSFAQQLLPQYNQQTGAFNDGHTAAYQSSPYGDVMHVSGPDGKVVRSVPLNPESVNQMITQAYMMERAGLGSGQFGELVRHQSDERKFGLDERRFASDDRYKQGTLGIQQQQADTMDRYRQDQIAMEKARLAQQRALHAASGGGGLVITPEQTAGLQALNAAYGEAKTPQEQATIAKRFQLLQNTIAIQNKKFPALGGLQNTPKEQGSDFMVEVDAPTKDGKGTMKLKMPYSQAQALGYAESAPGAFAFGSAAQGLQKPKAGAASSSSMLAPSPVGTPTLVGFAADRLGAVSDTARQGLSTAMEYNPGMLALRQLPPVY